MRSASVIRLLLATVACAAAEPAAPAVVADPPVVEVGIGGLARLGSWIAVSVWGVDGESLCLVAPDALGQSVSYPLDTPGDGGDANLRTGKVRFGRINGTLAIADGNRTLLEGPLSGDYAICEFVPWTRPIWVSDGGTDVLEQTVERAADFGEDLAPRATTVDLSMPADRLSAHLATADVLVVSGPPPSTATAALRDWVAGGGHLVVSFGAEPDVWTEVLSWSPVLPSGAQTFRQLSGLETAVPGGRRINNRRGVRGTVIGGEGAVTLVDSTQGPLVMRSAYGLGRVTALAIDLLDPAVAEWESLDGLGLLLTGFRPPVSDERRRRSLTRTGVTEVQTQLVAALDGVDTEGRVRPPMWTLLGYLAAYAVVVGLFDRFLVHTVLRRPQATWLTLPLWVGAACVIAARGESRLTTDPEPIRQMSIIDVAGDTGGVRGTSWSSISSGDLARLSVEAGRPFGASEWKLGWAATPENNFGGLYRRGGTTGAGARYRSEESLTRLVGIPFLPLSTRLFETDWDGSLERSVEGNLKAAGTRITGTLENHLDVPIMDWVAGFGNTLVIPWDNAPLRPGDSFPLTTKTVRQTTLREGVTGLKILTYEDAGESTTKARSRSAREDYDPLSTDVLRTLRIATFFTAAGGYDYAGIRASSPRGLDLTSHLRLNRLVLIGRVDLDAAPLRVDGEPAGTGETYVRVVVPITPPEVIE